MRIVIVAAVLLLMFTHNANADWKLLDTVVTIYGGGRETKIYYDSSRLTRNKKIVKVYIGMNKYPKGNEVEELSRATINCKDPRSNVEFHGSKFGNISAKNLLHESDVFEILVNEVCLGH